MAKTFSRPRGTQDILPAESWKWNYMEGVMRKIVADYGYSEIRLPTFEHTEVFTRSVGETTDIVSKEMYTFEDKGGRSITLRPEGTAGVVRAVLENGLLASSPLPLKSYYIQSCFRHERAQKGRLREFHQLGIECFGTHEAAADVEAMAVAHSLWHAFGVAGRITLEINSIGCPECRPKYQDALRSYFSAYEDQLCDTCKVRLEKNPMRLLDCKEERCSAIAKDAPVMLEYLCEDCHNHFEEVKTLLGEQEIGYAVNPRIVRGLDYYTNTVFEFIAEGVGTQGTVCAGGRYDGLIAQMGGQPAPAVGYGLGLERLLMLMEEAGTLPPPPPGPTLYAVAADESGRSACRKAVVALRRAGVHAECDLAGRSLKAQMKAAGRLGALFTVVLGETETQSGRARLKRMSDSREQEIQLNDIAAALLQAAEADGE